MTTNISGRIPIIWLGVCALLASLLTPLSAHAFKDRTASIEASGDAAIFDVTATAQGVLKVCTKPARPLDRWRVTIAVPLQPASASLPSVNSAVGNGSTTAFSGCVTQTVAANVSYIVLVTWDRPLPGTFLPSSAKATVHFTSATETVDPPIKGIAPSCGPGASSCLLANIIQRPNRWPEPTAGSPPEGSFIGCEGTVLGELNPASDSDVFKVTVPANSDISLNLLGKSGTAWRMYAPDGTLISNWCGSLCNVALPTAGNYTIQIWNGYNAVDSYKFNLLGVSTPWRCGPSLPSNGTIVTGKLDVTGDMDSYLFDGVLAGQTYSINIFGTSGIAWRMYAPDGTLISNWCSGMCNIKLPTAGGYTVQIWIGNNTTASYSLSAVKVGGP